MDGDDEQPASGRRRVGAWPAFLVLLVVGAIASLGVLAATSTSRAPLAGDTEASDGTVLVETHTTDDAVTATVTLMAESSRAIIVRVAGTVTSIDLASQLLTPPAGTIALSVDDRPVVAYYGDSPIAADVGADSPRAAITRVQEFLDEAGHLTGEVDGTWGQATAAATRRFLAELGLPAQGRFPASAVVWLGPERTEPAEVSVAVGDDIAPGDVIGFGGLIEADVRVRPSTDRPLDADTGWLLEIGETTVPLEPDYTLDVTDSLAVAGELDEGVETPGVVRRDTEVARTIIPGSAVVSDGQRSCVVAADTGEPTVVEVVMSGLEGVAIRATTDLPSEILLEPPVGLTC